VSRLAKEIALVALGVTALTFAFTRLRGTFANDYVPLLVGGLFLFTAMKMAQREKNGLARYGISLGGLLESPDDDDSTPFGIRSLLRSLKQAFPSAVRETGFALLLALAIFPPFALAFEFWNQPSRPFTFTIPDELPSFILGQFLVAGLTEEALFRGYFQTRLTDLWPARTKVFGVPLSIRAVLVQAVIFAVVHYVVDFNPLKLAVFFPALVFAWIRGARHGIGAAIVFHALSNIYARFLEEGWLVHQLAVGATR
jgi:uncharacterized protein